LSGKGNHWTSPRQWGRKVSSPLKLLAGGASLSAIYSHAFGASRALLTFVLPRIFFDLRCLGGQV